MNGSTSEDRKYIVTSRIPGRTDLSSSEAVLVGNTLYLGAHIGLDRNTVQPQNRAVRVPPSLPH